MTTTNQYQQDHEFLMKWSEVAFLAGEEYDNMRQEAREVIRRMKEYKRKSYLVKSDLDKAIDYVVDKLED